VAEAVDKKTLETQEALGACSKGLLHSPFTLFLAG
jgi:hypothetical protein